jgi:phosphoserine phosphatase RsbU/P
VFSLSGIPLFRSLPASELARLLDTLPVENAAEGAILVQEGQSSDRFYVILQGRVEIIKALGTSEESLLGRRGPGEFIGEMGLLNQNGLRTATARAIEDSRLLVIHFDEFNVLLSRYPNLAYELASVLSSRMTTAQDETIRTLQEKNFRLQQAYDELKAAQVQIIEKEKLERELQLAREIQKSILPVELPPLPGYDFGAIMTPARAVGGDFFGIFPLDAQRMVLIVGDVTDKGVPAAIFMAQTHALLRASASARLTPVKVLQRVNAFLMEMNDKGLFATVIYGVLHQTTGEFQYVRAGHELPLLLGPDGKTAFAEPGVGMPLGILDNPTLSENSLVIPPGGFLILYSDGVTDCTNPEGERLEQAGLVAFVQHLDGQISAQQACQAIFDTLIEFQREAPQFDDVTLLAVKRQ